MEFFFKIHRQGNDILLAIADTEIISKTLKEKDIEFEVSENFYKDKKADEKMLLRHTEKATIINAIGKDTVSFLVKNRLVNENSIITIEGVPHAQVIKM